MRALIHDHLVGLVPADDLSDHVGLMGVLTKCIVLESAEHGDHWPPSRQAHAPPPSSGQLNGLIFGRRLGQVG